MPSLEFDKEYYWNFITFSTEDHIFRVPKYRFVADSEVFASKYSLNADTDSEHDRDALPDTIQLDVGASDFRNFLKALYPKILQGELQLSKEEWLSVLRLSTKWSFNGFRKMAIKNLTSLNVDPIEKVQLGNEFNVTPWLESGYQQLVTRDAVITPEEAESIHYQSAIKIYVIRDGWNRNKFPRDLTLLDGKIHDAFASDFERVSGVEMIHLTARERKKIEKAKSSREMEAQEEALREEEYQRLQAAVAEAEQSLKQKNDALKKASDALKPPVPLQLEVQALISGQADIPPQPPKEPLTIPAPLIQSAVTFALPKAPETAGAGAWGDKPFSSSQSSFAVSSSFGKVDSTPGFSFFGAPPSRPTTTPGPLSKYQPSSKTLGGK